MSKFTSLLPKIALWILMALSVVAFAMVFIGGSVDPTAEYKEPVYTDVLLYWVGAIFAIALIITLGFALVQIFHQFRTAPGAAVKSMIGVLALFGLLAVGFFCINGFNYVDNEVLSTFDGTITLGMNQLSNMSIVSIGVLAVIAIVLIVFSGAFKGKVYDPDKK